jgi:hypothetical protein
VQAIHVGADPGVLPSEQVIGYDDWNQKTLVLDRGLYTHLGIYAEDGSTLTDTSIIDVSMKVDGETMMDKVKLSEAIALFNMYMAEGTSIESTSSTTYTGGEVLTDEPGAGASAGAGVTTEFLPLFTPPDKYKLTKCLEAKQGIRIDINGSGTSFRVYYRKINPRDASAVAKGLGKLGHPEPHRATVEVKTASKADLKQPEMAKYLPLRATK